MLNVRRRPMDQSSDEEEENINAVPSSSTVHPEIQSVDEHHRTNGSNTVTAVISGPTEDIDIESAAVTNQIEHKAPDNAAPEQKNEPVIQLRFRQLLL